MTDTLCDIRVGLLAALTARQPRTWDDLRAAGYSRRDVLDAVDLLTASGAAVFRVGPLLVERLDLAEGVAG